MRAITYSEGSWCANRSSRAVNEGNCYVVGELTRAVALETGSWCPNSTIRAVGEGNCYVVGQLVKALASLRGHLVRASLWFDGHKVPTLAQ